MGTYLGIPYSVWAVITCVALVSTFGTILLYRFLISFHPEDQAFMTPAEVRKGLEHIRHVNRMALVFGLAAVASLALAAAWAFRLL